MPGKHPTRRTVLETSATALLGALAGCTAVSPNGILDEWLASTHRSGVDLIQYLPKQALGVDGGFHLTSPATIRRDQAAIGDKQSAHLLGSTVGRNGWISDREIETQIIWNVPHGGWGYVFTTPLGNAEILKRYEESLLREVPVGSHEGYTLIERSSSWHAISDNEVIKIPTRKRGEATAFLDEIDETRTPASDIDLMLDEFDTRYAFDCHLFESAAKPFERTDIAHYGLCQATSPNPGAPGYTFTAGILTSSPTVLADWVTERESILVGDRMFNEPRVRTTGPLVLLEENGTRGSFASTL
jgi:hypothetical protein